MSYAFLDRSEFALNAILGIVFAIIVPGRPC